MSSKQTFFFYQEPTLSFEVCQSVKPLQSPHYLAGTNLNPTRADDEEQCSDNLDQVNPLFAILTSCKMMSIVPIVVALPCQS